jgi:hypothetical protein
MRKLRHAKSQRATGGNRGQLGQTQLGVHDDSSWVMCVLRGSWWAFRDERVISKSGVSEAYFSASQISKPIGSVFNEHGRESAFLRQKTAVLKDGDAKATRSCGRRR